MKNRKYIIHLQIGDTHLYFESLRAIFDVYTPEQLGVTYNTLRCSVTVKNPEYKNRVCAVRKGIIHRRTSGIKPF